MSQFCANSSFFTSGRKFPAPASKENSKFNGNFKGILPFEEEAEATFNTSQPHTQDLWVRD
jgi:hypothetical protein